MSKAKRKKTGESLSGRQRAEKLLGARVYRNESMEVHRLADGALRASIPLQRPRWLVPPLSWILPFSREREVQLDALGAGVLEMCDGRRTVESMIEKFAADHTLSFREAQVSVVQFLRQLTARGLVAIVGAGEDDDEA